MIDVYSWATPNGHKIHIMLEECGLLYTVVPVHIGKYEQFAPDFLKVSPYNKIPAVLVTSVPEGLMQLQTGFRMVAYGGDLWIYQSGLKKGLNALREGVKPAVPAN